MDNCRRVQPNRALEVEANIGLAHVDRGACSQECLVSGAIETKHSTMKRQSDPLDLEAFLMSTIYFSR